VKEAKFPNEFRPISISSALLRLYHKILSICFTDSCEMDRRQKGFLPMDGCAHNIAIMEQVILHAKRNLKSLSILFVDFKNAFGSVRHDAIFEACKAKGVPDVLLRHIKMCYIGAETFIGKT
jgi:hypothetical protein